MIVNNRSIVKILKRKYMSGEDDEFVMEEEKGWFDDSDEE